LTAPRKRITNEQQGKNAKPETPNGREGKIMSEKQITQLESIKVLARKQGVSVVTAINMLQGIAAVQCEWDLLDELVALGEMLTGAVVA
jgi:hypothetical protein